MQEKIDRLTSERTKIQIEIKKLQNKEAIIKTETTNLQLGMERLETKSQKSKVPKQRCTKCDSENVEKNGLYKRKGKDPKQKWKCLECGAKFTLPMENFEIPSTPKTYNTSKGNKKNRTDFKQTGKIKKLKEQIEQRVNTGESILLRTLEEETGENNGALWTAANILITEDPEKYEWYKDITKKYNLKGIRLKDENKRANAQKTAIYCPKCKSLMVPGTTCKKCK